MFMRKESICCPGINEALRYCARYLSDLGLIVTDLPTPDTSCLILPVPSFTVHKAAAEEILSSLPGGITICGGNMDHPLLAGHHVVDFLQDPYYLADNAAITADCAIQILHDRLGSDLQNRRILILGWGRIGKCLGKLLQARGADVTIAARKDSDLAMIHALGHHSVPIAQVSEETVHYNIILNTVPEMILPDMRCSSECVAVELASKPGMSGPGIICARGLPGKMAPERSGELIARTFIRLVFHKEVS